MVVVQQVPPQPRLERVGPRESARRDGQVPLREHVRGRARRRLAVEQVDDARHGVANFSGGRLEAARQRVPDAGTFTFNKEGHTAGELLRMQLLRDHQVQYAGYQLPHPLEHRMLIKVQTTGQTAAPVDVLKAAIVDLQGETEALDRGFRDGVAAVRERQMQI